MKKLVQSFSILLMAFLIAHVANSQVTIKGPSCVMPGIIYHYKIIGTWDSASTMQVCITGGFIKSKDSSVKTCTPQNGRPLGLVQVVWNMSGTTSLTVTSSAGSNTLVVAETPAFRAGSIAASSQLQIIPGNTIPATIVCAVDTGGSCSPVYEYQWQQSADGVNWVQLEGATGNNLSFTSPVTVATYYRRQVTEKKSGTIACSDVAAVFVDIAEPRPATSSGIQSPLQKNAAARNSSQPLYHSSYKIPFINSCVSEVVCMSSGNGGKRIRIKQDKLI